MRVVVMTPSAEATQARVQARTQSQAVIDAGEEDHQRKSPYRVMFFYAVSIYGLLEIFTFFQIVTVLHFIMVAIMMAHCLGREDLTCFSNFTKYRLLNAIQVSLAVIVLSNLVITYVYPEHSDFDGTGLFLCLVSMKVAYFVIVDTEQNLIENQADLEDNSPVML
ncbi:hypothetical protein L5515_005248 [Caenorhabditis briggsae]|uniref:Uncharacterized protein n=1 Tax=Caenorhabditis briggsae TaxID=6238 RepID=A0AAE9ENP4_CAEBR|nr:hypothetical protein L5515_005248 [Caenorhabditis briggsae]